MRKQCIVAILAILFSVMMASTAVPLGLSDSGGITAAGPVVVPEVVDEEVDKQLDGVSEKIDEVEDEVLEEAPGLPVGSDLIEELPSPGYIGERADYRYDDIPKRSLRTPSEIVSDIKKQGMGLTDEYGILRIGENGSVVRNITEEKVYRWVIGNKSIELIEDGNRTISPEDLKELIGEKGIVLVYTWQIGDEGIELVGENGTVPPGDLQEFMENHSFYLIGTAPTNSTTEESEETDSTMEEKETKESIIPTKQEQEKEIP